MTSPRKEFQGPGDSSESRADQAIAAYMALLDHRGDRFAHDIHRQVLAEFPECAEALRQYWETEEGFRAAVIEEAPLEQSGAGPADAIRELGDYALLELIGQGGMGRVYRGLQRSTRRIVAVKTMRGPFDEQSIARFRRETRLISQLRHPNIIVLHEAGQEGDELFYSMSHCDGGSLMDRISGAVRRREGGSWSVREKIGWMLKVARGLEHAHQQGVIHRDIKPHNILFDLHDEPVLADFGLARNTIEESHQLTRSQGAIGTFDYMSPEQTQSAREAATVESDLYAFGAALYHLLTGRPPFSDANLATLLARVQTLEPKRPSSLLRGVPKDLDSICLHCLEKLPERRYRSASHLAQDLECFLRDQPLAWATHTSSVERVWRWCRRNPVTTLLTSAVATLLLALAIGGPLAAVHQRRLAREATAEREAADAERLKTRRALAEVYLGRGTDQLQKGAAAAGFWNLWRAYAISGKPDTLRASALRLMAGWSRLSRTSFENRWTRRLAVFSPDHSRLLTTSLSGDVALWRRDEGGFHKAPLACRELAVAAFSPDSRVLITGDENGTAQLWDAATGTAVAPAMRHEGAIRAVAFSAAGDRALTGSEDGTARIWSAATGRPLTGALAHRDEVWCVAFSPDGTRVATAGRDYTARLWGAQSGEPLGAEMAHMGRVVSIAFSPDGELLATGNDDGTVRLWNGRTGEKHLEPLDHTSSVGCLIFSEEGRRVFAGYRDGTIAGWDVETGELRSRFSQPAGGVLSLAASRDGKLLAAGADDGQVGVWRLATSMRVAPPLRQPSAVEGVVFTAGEGRLLTAGDDGVIRQWQLDPDLDDPAFSLAATTPANAVDEFGARGGPALLEHSNKVWCVDFSPQTRMLAASYKGNGVRLWKWSGRSFSRVHDVDVKSEVWSLAFSPDGRSLLTGAEDGGVRLYDVASAKLLRQPLWHEREVWAVAFDSTGERFVTVQNDAVQFWDSASHHLLTLALPHPEEVWAADFSPDGRWLLTGCEDGRVRVWNLSTGGIEHDFPAHQNGVWAVDFHPHGDFIATAGGDGRARLWRLDTETPLCEPLRHAAGIWSVQFRPSGEQVLTGSWDSSAQLWDAHTGQPQGPPLLHQGGVPSAKFNAAGDWVLTASWDGFARVWDVGASAVDDPARIRLWLEVQTGLRLDERGAEVPLNYSEWRERQKSLADRGGSPFGRVTPPTD